MEDWIEKNWKLLDEDYLHDDWPINEPVTMWFDLDWVQQNFHKYISYLTYLITLLPY